MKLNRFLAYLTEAVDIDELREKIGNDVPASVLDELAGKMKGRKYDNIAMAIIKKIQDIKTTKRAYNKEAAPYIKFLVEHPSVIYSALRKAAKGNPNFDARKYVDDSIYGYKMTNSSPKKYWYSVYTSEVPKKNKEELGLKNAKVKELKQEYLIFPKTSKKIGEYGLSDNDFDKQWKELRELSAQIAKKDTSGEERDYGAHREVKKATDNHWCVASSDDSYYPNYKDKGGTFVIVVKKNKDGSPNWNERYLYYGRGYELGNDDDDEWADEFADKFDDHLDPDRVLSPEAVKILSNLSNKPSKVEKQNLAASDRVRRAYDDYTKNAHRTNTPEWQAFKTLINTINKWIYNKNKSIKNEGYFTNKDLRDGIAKFLKDGNIKNGNNGRALYDYMSEGGGTGIYHKGVSNYDFVLQQESRQRNGDYRPYWRFQIIADTVNPKNREVVFDVEAFNLDIVIDELKEEARKIDREGEVVYPLSHKLLYNKASFAVQKRNFHPKSNYKPDKVLRGNEQITRAYEKLKNDREYSVSYLPCEIRVKQRREGSNEFVVRGRSDNDWPSSVICDLLDPKMPEKVLKYLNEYKNVADGPDEYPF